MVFKKIGKISSLLLPLPLIVSCSNNNSSVIEGKNVFNELKDQFEHFLSKYEDRQLLSSKQINTLDSFVSTSLASPIKHNLLISSLGLEAFKEEINIINLGELSVSYKLHTGVVNEFDEKIYSLQVIMNDGKKVDSSLSFKIRSLSPTEYSLNGTMDRMKKRLLAPMEIVSTKVASIKDNDGWTIDGLDFYVEQTKTTPINYGSNGVTFMNALGLTTTKVGTQSYDQATITSIIKENQTKTQSDTLGRKWYTVDVKLVKQHTGKTDGEIYSFERNFSFDLVEHTDEKYNEFKVKFEKYRLDTLITNMRPNYNSGVRLPLPSEIIFDDLDSLGLTSTLSGTSGITVGVTNTAKINSRDDASGMINITFTIASKDYSETLEKSISGYQTTNGRINWEISSARNSFIKRIGHESTILADIDSSQISSDKVVHEEYKKGNFTELLYRFNLNFKFNEQDLTELESFKTTIEYNIINLNLSPKPRGLKLKFEMFFSKEGGTRTSSTFYLETKDYTQQ